MVVIMLAPWMLSSTDVIKVGPWMLFFQNGLDHRSHHAWGWERRNNLT